MPNSHGHAGINPSSEYNSWVSMKKRCYYPKTNGYHNYGGKGITVCDRWRNSFSNFLEDMGLKPTPKHSLDRYPNKNGNYEPGNCRWATAEQQQSNQNRTVLVDYNGETIPLATLARSFNIDSKIVYRRLKIGWALEKALTTPKEDKYNWGVFAKKTTFIKSDFIYIGLYKYMIDNNIPICKFTTDGITKSPLLKRTLKYKAPDKIISGINNVNTKKISGMNIETNELKIFYGLKEAADYIGVKKSNIANVINKPHRTIKKWALKHIN